MSSATDAAWKARDAHSYDDVADEFDRLTDRVSVHAAAALVDALGAETRTVLDVGCGTGVVALEAARRLGAAARITGIDLSPGMLATAREKARQNGLEDRTDFVLGDAEDLRIAPASFDAATSLYAWRHLPDPEKATAEVFRVLRAGGIFAVAVGSSAPLLSLDGLRNAIGHVRGKLAQMRRRELLACNHLERLVERHLPREEAYEEAGWTKAHHGFTGSMKSLLEAAGFASVRTAWLGREFEFADGDAFWTAQATFSSTARKRIAESPPAAVAKLRAAFDRECEAVLGAKGRLVYRVGAAVVVAVKP